MTTSSSNTATVTTGIDTTETIDSVRSVEVTDGHLHIISSTGQTSAVYAPGRWHSARLDA